MQKKYINPPDVHAPRGYSHAAMIEGGRTVFVSGQVALDADGKLVGKGDLRAQMEQALKNLVAVLRSAGASPADIVKLNTYVVNYSADDLPAIREVRAKFFGAGEPPASTLIGVQALAFEGLLVEIEAVATVA
jgi:enamine deaminase RidA (YjgF/YER057c/UK114 family)